MTTPQFSSPPPSTVGFIINPRKPRALPHAERARDYLRAKGIGICYPTTDLDPTRAHAPIDAECLTGAEMLLVFGGDGTLLAASRYAAPRNLPMLSVRYGGFGFLAEVEPDGLEAALDRIIAGDFALDKRMMLNAELFRSSDRIHHALALNDVAVSRGALSRVARIRTEVEEGYVATYYADGVIVSTPTGSTAYNLSVGGPLVHPGVPVLLITPVSPHSLNSRSLVAADYETVTLKLESIDEAMITADGQVGFQVETGDVIQVRKADCTADLVTFNSASFYERLQQRLHWADRFADQNPYR